MSYYVNRRPTHQVLTKCGCTLTCIHCRPLFDANNSCSLVGLQDHLVHEKVHLSFSSSLQVVIEKVDRWSVDFHLWQTVPTINSWLPEKVQTPITSTSFLQYFPVMPSSNTVYDMIFSQLNKPGHPLPTHRNNFSDFGTPRSEAPNKFFLKFDPDIFLRDKFSWNFSQS